LLERNLPDLKEVEEYNQRIEEMDKMKFEIAKNINGLEQECETFELQMNKLSQQLENLELEKTSIEQETIHDLPAIKHALSLYTNISNIRWDYENPQVKGCKSKIESIVPDKRSIRTFKTYIMNLTFSFY
jgi:chromosome segregation ATPase